MSIRIQELRGLSLAGRMSLAGFCAVSMMVGSILDASATQETELAKVNQKAITRMDLQEALSTLSPGQRESVLRDVNARRQLVQQMVDQEVLAQEGEKLKLDEEPEFKRAIANFRKQLLATQALAKKLEGQGTPKEARQYYESHKNDFSQDRVRVQHILLKDENEAKNVLKMAQDPAADFQTLAEKWSKDPSVSTNRGEVGWIQKGMMDPHFTEAAFSSKEGKVVGPVRTSFGYHIIKVVQKQFGKPLEYDEVELQVQATLRERLSQNIVDQLRKHSQIKIDTAAVDRM